MSALILTIDQGTTSTRAIVFDAQGTPRAVAQQEFAQHYPREGWVEHDPEEIWSSLGLAPDELMSGATITRTGMDLDPSL